MPDGFLRHGRRVHFQHQQIASVAVNTLDAELRLARIAQKNTQAGDLVEILATTARALHHWHPSRGPLWVIHATNDPGIFARNARLARLEGLVGYFPRSCW